MKLGEELRLLSDKVAQETGRGEDDKEPELQPETIEQVCQMTRLLQRQHDSEAAVKEALGNIKSESKNVQTYIDHGVTIHKSASKLCETIGEKHLKRENLRYREQVHKLNMVHLGSADGGDWREGMAEAKKGKPRTWQVYLSHATESILKCKEVADLDVLIENTVKAICESNGGLAYKNFCLLVRMSTLVSHRPDKQLSPWSATFVLWNTEHIRYTLESSSLCIRTVDYVLRFCMSDCPVDNR